MRHRLLCRQQLITLGYWETIDFVNESKLYTLLGRQAKPRSLGGDLKIKRFSGAAVNQSSLTPLTPKAGGLPICANFICSYAVDARGH